jgi:hypothetical protein
MEHYVAELIMEIKISKEPRNIIHRQFHLVYAANPKDAYRRALSLGKRYEDSYENPEGKRVQVKFHGIARLDELLDKLGDGAELTYDEYVGVTKREINELIPPKSKLQVFSKNTAYSRGLPNYASKVALEKLTKKSPALAAGPAARPGERPSTPARAGARGRTLKRKKRKS